VAYKVEGIWHFGCSTLVPTYFLIGPDGRLAASSTEWTKIKKELHALLDEAHE